MINNGKITLGILAYVDAGKTTLSECILYKSGIIRERGRVDHGDAFLDNHGIEKERGITIFSKQAEFDLGDKHVTLLDTPGHTDFSAEMERTLQVMDYAVLLVSSTEGIKGQVHTFWSLLERYNIPAFIFINKNDQEGADPDGVFEDIRKELSESAVCFPGGYDDFYERAALSDEDALNEYLDTGAISDETIRELIKSRKLFPCYRGSALKDEGVDELLEGMKKYMVSPDYPEDFSAKVFKITRDEKDTRLTHIKMTGGTLRVRDLVTDKKINQIRVYSGSSYVTKDAVQAGDVCVITGPDSTFAGQGLGNCSSKDKFYLDSVIEYQVLLPHGYDQYKAYEKLSLLQEEIPELHVVWNVNKQEVHVRMMGEVQGEVLKRIIHDRFGFDIEYGEETVFYKETIKAPVEGVGHFEPLRHYAEVHLLMEPLPPGSGIVIDSECSEDELDRNWQRLIKTHIAEKEHKGVLTGSAITDMKITLISGRAHQKHTEGGDFRQATYRAIRQGLMKAESVLLEPYYDFRLELPTEMVGRAMSDIQKMAGTVNPPETREDISVLTGSAPVSEINGYQNTVFSYTKGTGRISFEMKGYLPCHNEDEVTGLSEYNPDADIDNPSGSVFCSHGTGIQVTWDEVEDYMHIPLYNQNQVTEEESFVPSRRSTPSEYTDEDLESVFRMTYGVSKREKERLKQNQRENKAKRRYEASNERLPKSRLNDVKKEECLVVDGYNMIFGWEELKKMAKSSLEDAREALIDILGNYHGYCGTKIILVFDAYKQTGFPGETEKRHDIDVVYTKADQTADQYIEKFTTENSKKYRITVATSDGLEQIIVFGQGALRMPARELRERILNTNAEIREKYLKK